MSRWVKWNFYLVGGSLFLMLVILLPILLTSLGVFKTKTTLSSLSSGTLENWGTLSPEEAEDVLDGMTVDLFEWVGTPILAKEMQAALAEERKTYSDLEGVVSHCRVIKSAYKISYSSNGEKHVSEERILSEEPLTIPMASEKEYRLPWQLAIGINAYLEKDLTRLTYDALRPEYTYMHPEAIENPFPKDEVQRALVIDASGTIREAEIDGYFDKVETIEKDITITKYSRNSPNGSMKLTSTTYREEYELLRTTAKVKLKEVKTCFGIIRPVYKKVSTGKELIGTSTSTKRRHHRDGWTKSKTKTRTKTYQTVEEIVLDGFQVEDQSRRFAVYLNLVDIGEKNVEDLINLITLLPAGETIAGGIHGTYINQYITYDYGLLSAMTGFSLGNITIEPSELLLPIPRFYQNDVRWKYLPYGSSTIGAGGCGPTSAAMVLTGYTKDVITPVDATNYSLAHGYRCPDGTDWGFFKSIGGTYNVEVKQLAASARQEVLDALAKGHAVIASMSPGHFTSSGHFIVLTHINENRQIVVNDPYDPLGTKNRGWDPSIVLSEAKQYWIFYHPDASGEEETYAVDY